LRLANVAIMKLLFSFVNKDLFKFCAVIQIAQPELFTAHWSSFILEKYYGNMMKTSTSQKHETNSWRMEFPNKL